MVTPTPTQVVTPTPIQVVTPTPTQVVTPTPTLSPTPTITTSVPTPILTPKPVNLTIPIKAGYKVYQNNEYSYGFGYPNDWTMGDFMIPSGSLQGVVMSNELSNGVNVVVYSIDPKGLWDMSGGLDNLTKAGSVTARNITVNGREAFEVVSTDKFNPSVMMRWVTIQANGYYYMMNIFAPVGSTIQFDDIINSWVIGNISQ
jgi:hypothetical protein